MAGKPSAGKLADRNDHEDTHTYIQQAINMRTVIFAPTRKQQPKWAMIDDRQHAHIN